MADDLAHWLASARAMLGDRPGVQSRRKLAATLRAIADDLDRLADQEERRVRPETAPQARGQGRHAGDFVRLGEERVGRKYRLRLYIGRQLWYALGEPPRLDVQRVGQEVRLVAVREGGAGVALSTASGIPRLFVSQEIWEILRLNEGRYAAEVRGDTIVVGRALGAGQEQGLH